MRFAWEMNPRVIVLGVMCVMIAAVLIAARQPSHRAEIANLDAQPAANAPPDNVAMAARLETTKAVVSRAPATTATAKTYTADGSMENTPTVEPVKTVAVASASKAPPVESTVQALAVESTPKVVAVESTPQADVQNSAPATIAGCLELDEETFWLKDTSGADAPKSRRWRSGFLKKRPAPIELVDAAKTLRLPNHVGQRVAATGMLMHREMQVRSLQRIAASCS